MEKVNLSEFAHGIFKDVDTVRVIIEASGEVRIIPLTGNLLLKLTIAPDKLTRYIPPILFTDKKLLGYSVFMISTRSDMFSKFISMCSFYTVDSND